MQNIDKILTYIIDERKRFMIIPDNLVHLANHESGRAWLNGLPDLLKGVCDRWRLETGVPFGGSSVSYVVPAMRSNDVRSDKPRSDGQLVLKIQWPHEECMLEADALKLWDGNGAARLVEHDRVNHVLLMERCIPGITLADSNVADPIGMAAMVVQKLWVPTTKLGSVPFKHIKDEAKDWHADLSKNTDKMMHFGERRIIDAALDYLTELPHEAGNIVLTHQDLHGLNIISSERDGFLAIDPKPLLAPREFSLSPIIRSAELGHSKQDVLYRLDRLTSDLSLDRQTVAAWTIAQTMAWSVSSPSPKLHFEVSNWLYSAI